MLQKRKKKNERTNERTKERQKGRQEGRKKKKENVYTRTHSCTHVHIIQHRHNCLILQLRKSKPVEIKTLGCRMNLWGIYAQNRGFLTPRNALFSNYSSASSPVYLIRDSVLFLFERCILLGIFYHILRVLIVLCLFILITRYIWSLFCFLWQPVNLYFFILHDTFCFHFYIDCLFDFALFSL